MKKTLSLIAAIVLCSATAFAQDLQKATELAQKANESLSNGNTQEALTDFTAALEGALACTEESAAELVESCRTGIAVANSNLANRLIEDGQLEEALSKLASALEAAQAAGNEEIISKIDTKTMQLHLAIANNQGKAAAKQTDPATKAAMYKEALAHLDAVLEKDDQNAKAYLQKGQVLNSMGNKAEAVESIMKAKELGMGDAADKQLANIFVREASSKLKAKDFQGAINAATKSLEYAETANAYKIIGTACNALKDLQGAYDNLSKYVELAPNAKDVGKMTEALTAIKANIDAQNK